eukprot:TRINITY_DN33654_c0_g1_i1.p1 TRINITY_DN33654_c0_g1~~TRINITY_DN33654_c0_g1_i1.p1  ORF type:complete len:378 (+),score=112.68 TRINITY_DN33654_c0_g1_i1:70-1203(+)
MEPPSADAPTLCGGAVAAEGQPLEGAAAPRGVPDDRLLWELALSPLALPAADSAVEAGIPKLLAESGEPLSAPAMAERLSLSRRGVCALCAVLGAYGIVQGVAVDGAVCFRLSPTGQALFGPAGAAWGWRALIGSGRSLADPELSGAVLRSATTGKPCVGDTCARWRGGAVGPEAAAASCGLMEAMNAVAAAELAARLAAEHARDCAAGVLDAAGGGGCYARALRATFPGARVGIAELPAVCAHLRAEGSCPAAGVELHEADLFRDPWPEGFGVHLLASVLHDWAQRDCVTLLRMSFAALPPGGLLVLHEQLLGDELDGPLAAALSSVLMLIAQRGRSRSAAQLRLLCEEAGFADFAAAPRGAVFTVCTARKPPAPA